MDDSDDPLSTQDFHASSDGPQESFSRLHPTKIGRYTILDRLGKGGFGEVFFAYDEDLDRTVAIKVPIPERVSHPEDVEAYLKEAKILASLDHPHIVPVYDVGRTDDKLCFVVSKLIEGSDLKARIKQGRPPFDESAELIATIAEALHYAHTRGLVHRDIKPANILIDFSGKPFVTDFGLALKEEDFGKGSGLAGTIPYMSPEQARREGHRVDGRSDIFSLGVVFYELLTGRRPFVSKAQDEEEARKEVLDLIVTTEPRPPRQIDDKIPMELERICLKAMSKRPTDRYTTALDLGIELQSFLQSKDVEPANATLRRRDHLSVRESVVRLDGFSFQRTLGSDRYLAIEQRTGRVVEILAFEKSWVDPHQRDVFRRKFMADANVACRIDHRYILKSLSIIEKDEIVHLIREHVGESSLLAVVTSTHDGLSLSKRRELLVKIAEGLSYAHSQQLIHGNLIPKDILIDATGSPKIAFPNCYDQAGTPTYIAPEVMRSSQFDGRADIWSFGIIMFELLTGGKRPLRYDLREWPPAPTEPIPLRQIDKDIPSELERICLRCLSNEVRERYSTASDLAGDLRALDLTGDLRALDLADDLRRSRLERPSRWWWLRRNRG
jgi:serine/threonine protein kinase